MSYQNVTGTLSANSHPGSYCGQDAYNDMLIVEDMNEDILGRKSGSRYIDFKKCRGGQRMPDKDNFNCVIEATDTESRPKYIVRRLTPLECERLQGFPSTKKIDFSKMTKDEYIAYAIYNGDITVDAVNGKIFTTRGPGGTRLDKPRELIGCDCNGYLVSKITCKNTKLTCRHHRIIWISKYGVIPEGYVIDHINNNKKDNRIENLQLLTTKENSTKAKEEGLYLSGEDNKATKLSPELRDEVAFLYDVSDMTMREIANLYGISKSRVGQIVKEIGWTDIGDWTDSNGKVHKLSDSHRYKALGNSIALPSWAWVIKRMCAEYERPATMASLFDGISGFPWLWTQINGKGSVLWTSEIEEFPIAVCKKHFGDEETGEQGDYESYL